MVDKPVSAVQRPASRNSPGERACYDAEEAAEAPVPTATSDRQPTSGKPAASVDEYFATAQPATGSGLAGGSAPGEYHKRAAKREERIRAAHPRLGGHILTLTDDPQHTAVWRSRAVGEEKVASRLDSLASEGIFVLHDRRIPHSRANLDHVVIGPAGVFVIDAKRYRTRRSRPGVPEDGSHRSANGS